MRGQMDDAQKEQKENNKSGLTSARKDIIIISAIIIFVAALSYFFNLFTFIVDLLRKYPDWITFIDEIISIFVALSICLAVFAWRRLLELRKETARRIKLQEELLKAANTKAETEKIISRQLHVELEERKELERKKGEPWR